MKGALLRIALSALVTGLLGALLIGLVRADGEVANGIGTSPSADAVQLEAPPVCGIWLDVDGDAADQRSLAGEPPDILVFTTQHTSCSDAVTIGNERYPGRFFVRRARQAWRAYEAGP